MMISINSIANFQEFKANSRLKTQKTKWMDKHPNALKAAAATASIIAGGTTILVCKNKMAIMKYEEALKKYGVEIKDGIAYISKTGEKFTGSLKRNLCLNEKETVKFSEGKISERLRYNMFGRELRGEFYKDGKLAFAVGRHCGFLLKSFPCYEYNNGELISRGDVFNQMIGSVFKWARKAMKEMPE